LPSCSASRHGMHGGQASTTCTYLGAGTHACVHAGHEPACTYSRAGLHASFTHLQALD
jgi:hypothetical protein